LGPNATSQSQSLSRPVPQLLYLYLLPQERGALPVLRHALIKFPINADLSLMIPRILNGKLNCRERRYVAKETRRCKV
jgi:hypothetical protein